MALFGSLQEHNFSFFTFWLTMWRRENAWEKQTERQTECPTWWDQLGNHFGHVQTKKVVSLETAITCTHTQNNFSHILFSAWYNKLGWKLRGTIAHPVLTDPSALPMPQSRPPARPADRLTRDWGIKNHIRRVARRGQAQLPVFKDKNLQFYTILESKTV